VHGVEIGDGAQALEATDQHHQSREHRAAALPLAHGRSFCLTTRATKPSRPPLADRTNTTPANRKGRPVLWGLISISAPPAELSTIDNTMKRTLHACLRTWRHSGTGVIVWPVNSCGAQDMTKRA